MAKANVDTASYAGLAEETTRGTAEAACGGLQVAWRAAEVASKVQHEALHRSAQGTTELGRALVDLVQEQARLNLETWTALAGVVDWGRGAVAVDWERFYRIQREHLRASLERSAEFARRSLGVGQAGVSAITTAAWPQAREAA